MSRKTKLAFVSLVIFCMAGGFASFAVYSNAWGSDISAIALIGSVLLVLLGVMILSAALARGVDA